MDSTESTSRRHQTNLPVRGSLQWIPWVLGIALLFAVVAAALHFSEAQAFVGLAEQVEPGWFLLALLLQAGTYLAQGEIWRIVGRAASRPLPLLRAYELSLSKLFIDQALPSSGISGTVVLARALEARGMPRSVVMAGVVVNLASYNAVYAISLGAALLITIVRHQANLFFEIVSILFLLYGVTVTLAILALAGRRAAIIRKTLGRLRLLRPVIKVLEEADTRLAHDRRLLLQASACQLGIVLLDAATVWVLLFSLGVIAPFSGVFASFMLSSLFRTIGLLPGGLGTFEATSVLTLKLVGVPLPAALSATLLFRGLSFWLPMLPGLWFSRRMTARHPD
ncbi:MAG: flippase-like domain-containing protein [Candidatus Manganitrophaceae bacterium]|nr:MAG: flippase-like domain-containing protein [Candidatus Manganitrophaceae bacterium]